MGFNRITKLAPNPGCVSEKRWLVSSGVLHTGEVHTSTIATTKVKACIRKIAQRSDSFRVLNCVVLEKKKLITIMECSFN